jgi:hypothetical protein
VVPHGCNRPAIKSVRNFQGVAAGLFEAHSPDGRPDCVKTRPMLDDTHRLRSHLAESERMAGRHAKRLCEKTHFACRRSTEFGSPTGGVLTFHRVFAVLPRGIVLAPQNSGGEWPHKEGAMICSTAALIVKEGS